MIIIKYTTVARNYNTYIDIFFKNTEQIGEVYRHSHAEIIKDKINIIEAK